MNARIRFLVGNSSIKNGKLQNGFTLLEVIIAAGIVAFTLGSIYLTHWKTLDTIRQAHRSVNASQVLQEKAEMLRGLNWNNLTNSAYVSGSACLGGPVTPCEAQFQSVYSLTETIMLTEYPAPPSPGGYTISRVISYPSGAAVSSAVGVVSSSPLTSGASKLQGFLRITWVLNGSPNATQYSRTFETMISNPPQ